MAAPDAAHALAALSFRCSQVLAIARGDDDEIEALRAGAIATVRSPLRPEILTLHLRRLQKAADSVDARRDADEREAAIVRAETVQNVMSSLTHEICSPLSVVEVNAELLIEHLAQCRAGHALNWAEVEPVARECTDAVASHPG